MLTIRFNRTGKRNRAQFRIVVQEHTIAPGGRHVEVLGSYDPHLKKGIFKAERIKYWMEKGAQVSDSVWNLLIKNNIISGAKRSVKMKKKPVEAEKESVEKKPAEIKPEVKEEKEEAKEKKKIEEVKAEEKPVKEKTEKPETPKEENKKESKKE
jgi:small subunit ribosomal protein S16